MITDTCLHDPPHGPSVKMTSVEGPQRKLAYSRRVTAAFSMEVNGIHSQAVPTGLLDQIRTRLSSLGTRAG